MLILSAVIEIFTFVFSVSFSELLIQSLLTVLCVNMSKISVRFLDLVPRLGLAAPILSH